MAMVETLKAAVLFVLLMNLILLGVILFELAVVAVLDFIDRHIIPKFKKRGG